MFGTLGQAKKYLGQAAKMLIGIPDYDNYVEHMKNGKHSSFIPEKDDRCRNRYGRSCIE